MIPFMFEPYKHQIAMTEFGLVHPCCAFFSEMGTGKTKACIDLIRNRAIQNGVKKVLIIAPKSILGNWKREIEINTGNSLNVEIRILDGSKWERVQLLLKPIERLCFYIINYEGARILKDELVRIGFDFVVCDESTRIKDIRAARTKACVQIGKRAKYKLLLSGMPIVQNILDIHSQYLFLDSSILGWSFVAFRNKYFSPVLLCCPQKHAVYQKKSIEKDKFYCYKCNKWYQNNESKVWKWECKTEMLQELTNKIYEHAIRFRKVDCIDLPEQVYETREIFLNDEEIEIYKEMDKLLHTEIDGKEVSASIILTKLIRLAQITSGFAKDENGIEREIKNPSKLQELEDLLDETAGEKIIIWCNFVHNIQMIAELLNKKNISYVTFFGDTKDRDAVIQKFETDSSCRVFVGNPQTGGLGINLVSASIVVYFSQGFSLESRIQSESRTHRLGQTKKVTYVDLVANKTIDEYIIQALRNKKSVADCVIEGWRSNK
jgi:SNF2 family DNA or RNA helicase